VNAERRPVTAGVVGRWHGLDGSFAVERPSHPLEVGTEVELAGTARRVERRAGTDKRPLLRLSGIDSREAVSALRGEPLLVRQALGEGEWLAEDLVGCRVVGLGSVRRIIDLPSCDALELEDGMLVPLISDAIERLDLEAGEIEVNRSFLRLEPAEGEQ
jgi:16S rRNA processing protein RimM